MVSRFQVLLLLVVLHACANHVVGQLLTQHFLATRQTLAAARNKASPRPLLRDAEASRRGKIDGKQPNVAGILSRASLIDPRGSTVCFALPFTSCNQTITDCCGKGDYDLQLTVVTTCKDAITKYTYGGKSVNAVPVSTSGTDQSTVMLKNLRINKAGGKFCISLKRPCANVIQLCPTPESCTYTLKSLTGKVCMQSSVMRPKTRSAGSAPSRSQLVTVELEPDTGGAGSCDLNGECSYSE